MAKGAIAAGIELLSKKIAKPFSEIRNVYLAGAFGTYMNPHAACQLGLIPKELEDNIIPVGNAAGSGAKLLALDPSSIDRVNHIVNKTIPLNLASQPEFSRCFAKNMRY